MTRYGRYTHCDQCGATLYEGDFIKVHDGSTYCEDCWKMEVGRYLFDEYIPNHLNELLIDAADELEEQG